MARFALDLRDAQYLAMSLGATSNRPVMRLFRIRGQKIENVVYGGGNRLVGGEQTEVAVKTRGRGIVIPRAKMRVPANFSVRILPNDQHQFRMCLQPTSP